MKSFICTLFGHSYARVIKVEGSIEHRCERCGEKNMFMYYNTTQPEVIHTSEHTTSPEQEWADSSRLYFRQPSSAYVRALWVIERLERVRDDLESARLSYDPKRIDDVLFNTEALIDLTLAQLKHERGASI